MDLSQSPLTVMLIASNVAVYFISSSNSKLVDKAIMWPYFVKRKNEYHRFVTSGFLHADFMHLFFNMFTLYFFGSNLEYIAGHYQLGGALSYLGLYFGALVIGDIPCYLKYRDSYGYRSLGASGAVSAVVFGMILFDPWSSIYIYGAIRMSAVAYAILFIFYCIYMGKRRQDNVNHDAHLWGALFGLACMAVLVQVQRPDLFKAILEELSRPSLLGRG